MLMALCLSTLAGLAQNTQSSGQVTEESKTTFKPHWYMQEFGAALGAGLKTLLMYLKMRLFSVQSGQP